MIDLTYVAQVSNIIGASCALLGFLVGLHIFQMQKSVKLFKCGGCMEVTQFTPANSRELA